MMLRRLFTILLLAAAYCSASSLLGSAGPDSAQATACVVKACHTADDRGDESDNGQNIVSCRPACCAGIAAISHTGTGTAPVSVRTLSHDARPVWRHASCGFMARVIDSSHAAGRYGLYNHKILFASRSVDQYLHKMCRLVI